MTITLALLLTASAPFFALFARGRRALLTCALVFVINELLYLSAWASCSPHRMLLKAGIAIPSSELWAVGDCVAGLAIVMALMDVDRMRLAGLFLILHLTQIGCYIAMHGAPPADPSDLLWSILDYCFYATIAIFAMLGGGGIVDYLIHLPADRSRALPSRLALFAAARRKVHDAQQVKVRRRDLRALHDMIGDGRIRDATRYLAAKIER